MLDNNVQYAKFTCLCGFYETWVYAGGITKLCPHCSRIYKGMYDYQRHTFVAMEITPENSCDADDFDWNEVRVVCKPADPTPAELCQQLADDTGNNTEVVVTKEGACIATIGGYIEPIYNSDNTIFGWAITKGHSFRINRPVSYTGRWQDSKVTATPKEGTK